MLKKQKAFLFWRKAFIWLVMFYTIRLSSSGSFPVVVDVVVVVLLLIIYNVCKVSRYFLNKQMLFSFKKTPLNT